LLEGFALRRVAFTFARRIVLLTAITCVMAPAAAPAVDLKPDATIKNRTVEASVFVSDGIKADSALAADCVAEGKKWIDKQATDAASQRKTDPQMFRDGAWNYERKYDIRTILWDRTAKKRISIRPFFTETADNSPTMRAILKAVIASLNIEKKKRDATETATAEWFKSLEPKLLKIGAVTLAPSTEPGKSSGLTFHYPPYAVGPYAEGEYVAFVPWETLKPYLSQEGASIFAGARPEGDDDGSQ
jgi:hypothetical protein